MEITVTVNIRTTPERATRIKSLVSRCGKTQREVIEAALDMSLDTLEDMWTEEDAQDAP